MLIRTCISKWTNNLSNFVWCYFNQTLPFGVVYLELLLWNASCKRKFTLSMCAIGYSTSKYVPFLHRWMFHELWQTYNTAERIFNKYLKNHLIRPFHFTPDAAIKRLIHVTINIGHLYSIYNQIQNKPTNQFSSDNETPHFEYHRLNGKFKRKLNKSFSYWSG